MAAGLADVERDDFAWGHEDRKGRRCASQRLIGGRRSVDSFCRAREGDVNFTCEASAAGGRVVSGGPVADGEVLVDHVATQTVNQSGATPASQALDFTR